MLGQFEGRIPSIGFAPQIVQFVAAADQPAVRRGVKVEEQPGPTPGIRVWRAFDQVVDMAAPG
jgi:hypothetical protein